MYPIDKHFIQNFVVTDFVNQTFVDYNEAVTELSFD